MTPDLPDRDTLAQVMQQNFRYDASWTIESAWLSAADAVLDHLQATSAPPTPATDRLREAFAEVALRLLAATQSALDTMPEARVLLIYEARDLLRAALAPTDQPGDAR